MDARGPPLRPSLWRLCRRRRLRRLPCPLQELRADPRNMETAAALPTSRIARSGPSPTCLAVLRPFRRLPGARSSGERSHKTLTSLPQIPPWWSSPLRLYLSIAGSTLVSSRDPPWRLPPLPSRSVRRRIDEGAAEIRRPFRDASAGRKAKGLAKQQEDLRLGSPAASAPASSPPCRPRPPLVTFMSAALSYACRDAKGFFAKTKRYIRNTLKIGLRVYFKETEGLFRKNADDVRAEALRALLVGKDVCV
ncbi:uncharacterized protein [Triticum aestivum]|uniref:uncharacterized protein isoform X2 n=1 Tax=Triticum aestivum TaxID=4565 RepID=UPI001D00EEA1|nr:uncharacterized protein LOC123133349 isoform X2 [Triticum aestivum]